jgi:putative methylase
MATKSALRRQLDVLSGFDTPRVDLEQYRTPPELAAHLVHTADLREDIEGQLVVDLGCGTGILALAATVRTPADVVGIEVDPDPLAIARENERRLDAQHAVSWIQADATTLPLSTERSTTVLMNPPFGAQSGNEHADREFLATTADFASVSYSIHNEGSYEFVESFAEDNGGKVTDAFAATLTLPQTYEFHTEQSRTIDVEVFRIDWTDS